MVEANMECGLKNWLNPLKAQPGKYMSVGGPTLAAAFMRLDLIDEFWLYLSPIKIDPRMEPEIGYDRDKCIRYIRALKKKHGIAAKACSRCFSVCPWGYDKVFGLHRDSAAAV